MCACKHVGDISGGVYVCLSVFGSFKRRKIAFHNIERNLILKQNTQIPLLYWS